MSLDEFILGNVPSTESSSFLMQVGTESMSEEGIFPGDYLIVERQATAKPGDLVIASTHGEFTLRYFSYFQSRNISPLEYKLEAVVKAVIRKY